MITMQSALLADIIRAHAGAHLLRVLVRAQDAPDLDLAMYVFWQARCAQLLGPDQYA
jgi:hypothetical protein